MAKKTQKTTKAVFEDFHLTEQVSNSVEDEIEMARIALEAVEESTQNQENEFDFLDEKFLDGKEL